MPPSPCPELLPHQVSVVTDLSNFPAGRSEVSNFLLALVSDYKPHGAILGAREEIPCCVLSLWLE